MVYAFNGIIFLLVIVCLAIIFLRKHALINEQNVGRCLKNTFFMLVEEAFVRVCFLLFERASNICQQRMINHHKTKA